MAQDNAINTSDTTDSKKVKILPFPTLGYEPETKFHLGVVSLFTLDLYQDNFTRLSNAKIEFNYTFRDQVILESEWSYFFKKEEWFSEGIIHFSKYPDFYYGLGVDVPESNKLLYQSNRFILDMGLYKRIHGRLFFGGGLRYLDYFNLETKEFNPFPELTSERNIGLHSSIFYDTRNNLLNASKGVFARIDAGTNWGSNSYGIIRMDGRKYWTFSHDIVLATRIYNSFSINQPNFYDYSFLGGDDYVRGYFYGKYRDRHLSTFQLEIRTPQVWRFGLAIISGLSSVYSDMRAPFILRPNYGLGLRYIIDRSDDINLRFDYVLGTDNNSGFYISFGESF
jgi:hypothetical protein